MAVFSGNGTDVAPSFTFSSDTNTGMYRVTGDSLGFTTNGTLRGFFNGSGNFAIGTGTSPGETRLHVRTDSNGTVDQIYVQNRFSSSTSTARIAMGNGTTDYGNGYFAYVGAQISGTNQTGNHLIFGTNANAAVPTEKMRLTTDGYLRMASGTGGIQFGGDTAAANALDDYEEGTFSPVPTNFTSPLLLQSDYIKVGGLVTIYFYWVISANNAPYTYNPADVVQFTGLPFITTTGSDIHGVVVNVGIQNTTWAAFSGHREFFAFGERGGASIRLFDKSTGAAITYGDLYLPATPGASPGVRGTFTYRAS